MSKINQYKFWWVQCTTAGPNSKATGWKLYTWARPTVLYDPRSSFPTAYPPTANVLRDSKLFPHFCQPCCGGMLRFLMLILTTFSPLGAAPGWYKMDAYVKYKISGGIKTSNFSWAYILSENSFLEHHCFSEILCLELIANCVARSSSLLEMSHSWFPLTS